MTTTDALRLEHVSRHYGTPPHTVAALDDVTLTVPAGGFTAVMGPSGSGKSTLLQCAAGLDRPTAGTVTVAGTDPAALSETRATRWRRQNVGFVFQGFHLLPYLTAVQNVELPLRLTGRRVDGARVRAALDDVGLGDRLHHLPAELSGGQQQRVAVARALVTRPAVVLADEPTGALDSQSARAVLGLLAAASRDRGRTIVMVTHDPVAAAFADAVVFLADGAVHGTMTNPTAEAVAAQLAGLGAPGAPVGAR